MAPACHQQQQPHRDRSASPQGRQQSNTDIENAGCKTGGKSEGTVLRGLRFFKRHSELQAGGAENHCDAREKGSGQAEQTTSYRTDTRQTEDAKREQLRHADDEEDSEPDTHQTILP
jgi:hypothetical protein